VAEYETVVNIWDLLPDLFGVLPHAATVVMQAGLALYLFIGGARRLGSADTRILGVMRLALGALLIVPFAAGTHYALTLLACGTAFVLIALVEPSPGGRGRLRRFASGAAIGSALVVGAFAIWEREDPLELGMEVLTVANDWRAAEIEWQTQADATAPKLGELAPDFELKDPEGVTAVRLADYRGKRPVALIFGSYT
jgi:hypothetical protein